MREDCLSKLKVQDKPQNNFLPFLTSWKYFYYLTIFRGYHWNSFETEIRGMFFEYSGNITSWLLEFAKRSTFVIVKSYILNTKTIFPSRIFYKIFSFKMFPGCSEDCNVEGTLSKYSRNIACRLGCRFIIIKRSKLFSIGF